MCPFELYMFIGVSMQLRVVFKYDFLVLIPYCWSVALEKKNKKTFILPLMFIWHNGRFNRSLLPCRHTDNDIYASA